MFRGDPNQSTKELLDEIKEGANRGAMDGNLTYLMPAIAALFVKLSAEADRRAQTIVWLTGVLTGLTIILVALTVALLMH